MKSLLLHANKFETRVGESSARPVGIEPENRKDDSEKMDECLVAFFCVEKNDEENIIQNFCDELIKTSREFGTNNIMIAPFSISQKILLNQKRQRIIMRKLLQR